VFDGMAGNVAYDLDLGEGWLGMAVLKATFYKLALGRPLKGLKYYVRENFSSGPNTYKFMKRKTRTYDRILSRHGIKLQVLPARLVVKGTRKRHSD